MKLKQVMLIFSAVILLTGCVSGYNAKLARQLGADDYGMKNYVLVMLKTGPNKITEKSTLDSLFKSHMTNIQQLSEQGKMIVAGPLQKNENQYRGIFILDAKDMDEAAELLKKDPTIREKILEAEMYTWYGSAALPEYLKMHSKIEKIRP